MGGSLPEGWTKKVAELNDAAALNNAAKPLQKKLKKLSSTPTLRIKRNEVADCYDVVTEGNGFETLSQYWGTITVTLRR